MAVWHMNLRLRYNYNYAEAYMLLKEHKNDSEYKNAIKHLAIALNNKGDRVVNAIVDETGETRSEIVELLNEIEKS